MNTDSFFTIGTTHRVCEDYCLSTHSIAKPLIVLSDGCSSSKDTDFGSRILVKAAQNLYESIDIVPSEKRFLDNLWDLSKQSVNAIGGLSDICLDATLIIGFKIENAIQVIMVGDGTVSAKAKDGSIHSKTVDYKGNAPLYLSYLYSDPKRKLQREKEFDCTKTLNEKIHKNGNILTETSKVSNEMIEVFTFPLEDFDFVSIFSDGVSSFVEPEKSDITKTFKTFKNTPEHIIIEKAMDFKNTSGEFVRRRCQRLLKDLTWNGVTNTDDFSIATIYTGK
jgi:hypothetical protein